MFFKRIYIEISDYCNLDCSFCTTKKNTNMMSLDKYKYVLDSIKGYTNEVMLHVLGEPLIHKDILKILDYTYNKFNIVITTNGFLLKKFKIKEFIKFNKMNISIHSSYFLNDSDTLKYLDSIIDFINYAHKIDDNITFNLRLWANTSEDVKKHNDFIIKYLNEKFDCNIIDKNIKIKKRVIVTFDHTFTWPSLNNPFNKDIGTCKGGKTHISIKSNGDIGICCLDSNCDSNLGNIFNNSLEEILYSDKFKNTINGFNNNKLILDICKHCTYHNRKE